MNLTIDGKTVQLNRRQEELVWQKRETRRLEEKAAQMLERFSCGCFDDLLSLWLDARQDPAHPDYICDVLAQQFLQQRNDNEPDVNVWNRVIQQELEARQNGLTELQDSDWGWLRRPVENLVRLCWRNRFQDFSVTFTTDEMLTDGPKSLFTLTLSCDPEGKLVIQLQDACSKSRSDMVFYLDEDGQPQCDYQELAEDLREYLQVYNKMQDRPEPSLLWIRLI